MQPLCATKTENRYVGEHECIVNIGQSQTARNRAYLVINGSRVDPLRAKGGVRWKMPGISGGFAGFCRVLGGFYAFLWRVQWKAGNL